MRSTGEGDKDVMVVFVVVVITEDDFDGVNDSAKRDAEDEDDIDEARDTEGRINLAWFWLRVDPAFRKPFTVPVPFPLRYTFPLSYSSSSR